MLRLLSPFLLLVLFAACQDELPEPTAESRLLTTAEIDRTLYAAVERSGVYHWSGASDELLWSAAMQSDSIFAVGYQPVGFQNIETEMHRIDLTAPQWADARETVIELVLTNERALRPGLSRADLFPMGEPEVLPTLALHFTNPATVRQLRELAEIRYVEPMGYELAPLATNQVENRDAGCDGGPDYNLNPNDYTTIAPNVKQSWHHAASNISGAWAASQGSGVTIAIIDTGASFAQDNLGSQFTAGYSGGRSVQKISTLYSGHWWWRKLDSPNDDCGHGTAMSGFATAPRGNDGNAVGVAYKSNLLAIRAVEDVIISSSNERDGVKNALINAGSRSDVKVISMSIGTPFWSGTVADGVYYANGQGKTILAAAGTSLTWTTWYGVIFPASMNETVAVTGVRDGSGAMDACSNCHEGGDVDFVMVMQRDGDSDRNALTLATSTDQPAYVGGSSAATASVAGIAALVYAQHPGATRQQVYNTLRNHAGFYPNKDNDFGWGIIDAAAAVNDPI